MNKFKHLHNLELNIEMLNSALSSSREGPIFSVDLTEEGTLFASVFSDEYSTKRNELQRKYLEDLKTLLVEEKKRTLKLVMEQENGP